ncbi:MAG: PspC domain-containing protein [Elusimicrobiales bacterium]|nr:PspC domain-containing protein [Elusimicrobiales bacterium]
MKRLYRSKYERTIAGVFGGLSQYFNIDPIILRALYVLFTIFTFGIGGLIAYIVLIFVIPINPNEQPPSDNDNSVKNQE